MYIEQYICYIFVITILLISPGPSVLLSINNGLIYGKRLAALGVLGNVIAFQLLLIASCTGIGAIVLTFEKLLSLIKVAGSVYLCYVGIKLHSSPTSALKIKGVQSTLIGQPRQIFKQAFWITLLNPKALVFVSALLPQFINPKLPLIPQIVILCIISGLIHFTIYFSYANLGVKLLQFIGNENSRGQINKFSGLIFILFGISMVFFNPAS